MAKSKTAPKPKERKEKKDKKLKGKGTKDKKKKDATSSDKEETEEQRLKREEKEKEQERKRQEKEKNDQFKKDVKKGTQAMYCYGASCWQKLDGVPGRVLFWSLLQKVFLIPNVSLALSPVVKHPHHIAWGNEQIGTTHSLHQWPSWQIAAYAHALAFFKIEWSCWFWLDQAPRIQNACIIWSICIYHTCCPNIPFPSHFFRNRNWC